MKNKNKSLSASTRWPLIPGTFPLKSDRDIGKLSVHSRWSLIAGAAEDRFYCSSFNKAGSAAGIKFKLNVMCNFHPKNVQLWLRTLIIQPYVVVM